MTKAEQMPDLFRSVKDFFETLFFLKEGHSLFFERIL